MTTLDKQLIKNFTTIVNPIREEDGQRVARVTITPMGVLDSTLIVKEDGAVAWADRHPVKITKGKDGYYYITLRTTKHYKTVSIGLHRLVYYSFNSGEWSAKMNKSVIHHIDHNKANNHIDNLMMTTNSDNVSRFFDGRDNATDIANQQYLNDRIAQGKVPLLDDRGNVLAGYSITADAHIYHINKRGEKVEVKTSIANPKYPTNKNFKTRVNGQDHTWSLHRAVANNFLVKQEGKYKVLMKDSSIDNPYEPHNLYTVTSRH